MILIILFIFSLIYIGAGFINAQCTWYSWYYKCGLNNIEYQNTIARGLVIRAIIYGPFAESDMNIFCYKTYLNF